MVDGSAPAQPKPDVAERQTNPLLEVQSLETRYSTREGIVHAVNGISFSLHRGQTLALVGESGCGKTATILSLLGLLPSRSTVVAQKAEFLGRDLLSLDDEQMRRIRGAEIGTVFQDPQSSLNPVLTIGRQLTETLEVHQRMSSSKARARAIELLRAVGIPQPEQRIDDYPHQFSGGMCQRVMIAIALSCEPSLLIADEPTTALDVTIQSQVLELVSRLRADSNMAIIWITHDLSVVSEIADWVAVMYGGFIVEYAPAVSLFGSPQHPYTRGLLESIPTIDGPRHDRLASIPGQPPNMTRLPTGCVFADRCDHEMDRCRVHTPPLTGVDGGNRVACWWDAATGREREAR